MKFKLILNKNANFYYFLHNLAEIKEPLHYRKWNIMPWKKELNFPFSSSEATALKKFKKKYYANFPKIYLGRFFFLEKNSWETLKNEVGQEEINILNDVFRIWKNKFFLIYRRDLPNLKKWRKKLEIEIQKLSKSSLINFINTKLIKFFNAPVPFKKKLKIYLMLCGTSNTASGERGRGLDGKSILIEISRCPTHQINYVIGVIWHEYVHCCLASYHLRPLLLNFFKNDSKVLFAEEIIVRSLFPTGIFGIKFFKICPPSTLTSSKWETLPKINKKQTKMVIDLTDQYLQKEKKIDTFYVKKIGRILKI
ncbi:MAG: hypothetical protein Q8N22_01355 [bacterium]|nr:hypothetical protein [bacterium]